MRGAKCGFQKADGREWIQPPQLHPDELASISPRFWRHAAFPDKCSPPRSAFLTQLARSALFTNARLALETLSYEWDTSVLAFDADVQEVLLDSMGLANRGPFVLIVEILIVAIALLVIYFGWMQLRTRSGADQVKALYERFCRKAARLGVRRDPWEGPADFSRRAALLLPDQSERIRQISNIYIALRYAPESAGGGLDRFVKEVRAFAVHR